MKNILLVVDDVEINRLQLMEIFREQYITVESDNGEDALIYMKANKDQIAAVLLDIKMDKMNGVRVLEEMRKAEIDDIFPVIMITSFEAVELERQCFRSGCADYIIKPFDATIVERRVNNIVRMYGYRDGMNEVLAQVSEERRTMHGEVWNFMANLLEFRSVQNGNHIRRMQEFSKILAEKVAEMYPKYGFNDADVELLIQAVRFHDIGKITIPDSILLKPSRLTEDEFEMMKSHTTKGSELISQIDFFYSEKLRQMSYDVCRSHHERYDGRGYPDGLKGKEIPIVAQIVSLTDAYEALVTDRVYKEAYEHDVAYTMIVTGECGVFAPDILDCFNMVKKDFAEVK